jgi:hypothetical protein
MRTSIKHIPGLVLTMLLASYSLTKGQQKTGVYQICKHFYRHRTA